LDDGLGVFLLGLGREGDGHAVAQHILSDTLHVLWRDESASAQKRVRLGRERERDGGARRGTELDEVGDVGAEKIVMSSQLDRKQVEVTESTRMVTNVNKPAITIC